LRPAPHQSYNMSPLFLPEMKKVKLFELHFLAMMAVVEEKVV